MLVSYAVCTDLSTTSLWRSNECRGVFSGSGGWLFHLDNLSVSQRYCSIYVLPRPFPPLIILTPTSPLPPTPIPSSPSLPPLYRNIPANGKMTFNLDVNGCKNSHGHNDHVQYLEHVQARITLMATRRGELEIYLISPLGTRSCLLAR